MVWKPNVTVAAVVEHDGRYLLVEEVIEGRRVFNQPAGHLEPGESLPDAARREVREETGWAFEPEALVAVQLLPVSDALTFLRFTFCGNVHDHRPGQPLDEGIVATHWLTRAEIEDRRKRLRSPLVLDSVHAYESGQRCPLSLLRHYP
ncbi:phosphatase NudJ [Methylomarinovum caldicuralii]|uniref:Phosphatase NudJ n=1 Tax=Methylomarinovum caldicuralii TaxID=438856 RepID=A0AAU9C6C6_9GAMM|nr:NUDIX hydrolase [Methylomarinovum caldicuralii]BCX80991.1 phosphatase NudJ [Methylomarinovum caldicuralii]